MYSAKVYFNDNSSHLIVAKTKELVVAWLNDYKGRYDGKKSKRKIVRQMEPVRTLATTINVVSKSTTSYYALSTERLIKFEGIDDLLSKLSKIAKERE